MSDAGHADFQRCRRCGCSIDNGELICPDCRQILMWGCTKQQECKSCSAHIGMTQAQTPSEHDLEKEAAHRIREPDPVFGTKRKVTFTRSHEEVPIESAPASSSQPSRHTLASPRAPLEVSTFMRHILSEKKKPVKVKFVSSSPWI